MIFSLSHYKTTRNFFLSAQHPVLALYNSRKIHQPPQVQKLVSKAQISRVLLINHVKDHLAWPSSVAFEGQLTQSTQARYPEIPISPAPRTPSSFLHTPPLMGSNHSSDPHRNQRRREVILGFVLPGSEKVCAFIPWW